MASVRASFTLDAGLLERARQFDVNVSAAARDGVAEAVRQAMIANDIGAYKRNPEVLDPFWVEIQALSSD
jgi:hypothetical protein